MAKISKASDIGLGSDSFKLITDTEPPRSVILNIEAGPKMGKTHFGLAGAPDPVVIFNHDQGIAGMIEKFVAEGRKIIVAGKPRTDGKYPSYRAVRPTPKRGETRKSESYLSAVMKEARPLWDLFTADYQQFLESDARTGIIDTGTAAFDLAKLAYLGIEKGKLSAKQDPYGKRSGEMRSDFQHLIHDAYNYDKNIIWLHREKELWADNKPSGKYAAAGYPDIAYEVHMTIRLTKERGDGKERIACATVKSCRPDPTLEGGKFKGQYCTFKSVVSTAFGTEEEDWE